MERRDLLGWLLGAGVCGAFGYISFRVVSHFLPPPPRKVLVPKEKLPGPGNLRVMPDFFVVRDQERLRVFARRCPHLGCTLRYYPPEGIFLCPCHQSRFALNGRRLSGPAPRGMYTLRWEKSEGGILVEIPG